VSSPETRYAKSGDLNIAYQVVGDGPFDLVFVPGFVSNVELLWELPGCARYLNRLASFSRLIMFDKRGTGMSDRVARGELPTLEDRMDDLKAVLAAVGSERAALLSHSEGGSMSILYAATYPARTIALVTVGVFACRIWSEAYPWAPTPEERAAAVAAIETDWGKPASFLAMAPSIANDPSMQQRMTAYFRQSASPGDAAQLLRINTSIDVRQVLPSIQVPTLMLHRSGDRDVNVDEGRWIARQIPGARFIELSGDDHLPFLGDTDAVLDPIQEFLTGTKGPDDSNRVLATVLLTDIVSSTALASELGDARWTELLTRHDALAKTNLDRYRGRLVKSTGDGILALFDGPARAVRCAQHLGEELRREGLTIRSGIHTGEIELHGDDIAGVAVHIASRIEALAGPDEVLVSRTVVDLVSGSGLTFESRGEHDLPGVPGTWTVLAAS
jgi:pimeloyl-ACP methyl ester carboxylesterase